jgi:catechol 2,3-dioxygenase-like lactoylglutathione lyase family enzyme
MTKVRVCRFVIMLAVGAIGPLVRPQDAGGPSADQVPRLANVCLITNNMKRLVDFYEPILEAKAKWSGEDYAEFRTSIGVLAVFAADAQEKYIPGSARAAQNRSVILEFSVVDVDLEYKRLQGVVKVWVKPPTTQPWGTRSIYFRDPDGNLVDFFTPPKR